METITSEKIQKIRRRSVDTFLPLGEALRSEGFSDREICGRFNQYIDAKIKEFYRLARKPKHISEALRAALEKKEDSKTESIVYNLLRENKIFKFEMQYKIGIYRVDFLVEGFLVVEVDGPHHNQEKQVNHDIKRDGFLESMGYKILRLPIWLIAMDPEAAIIEIKDIVNKSKGGCTK